MLKEIADFLNQKIPAAKAQAVEVEVGTGHVKIEASEWLSVAKLLKNTQPFDMNVLEVVSGVDFKDRIEVNYMLASFTQNTEAMIKISLPKTGALDLVEVDSVCALWKAANFQERECFDMLGVSFRGHPDLRRILCPEDWEGFPLRKDYQVQETYQGMTVNPIEKVNQRDHHFYKEIQAKYDVKQVSFSWKGDSEGGDDEAADAEA